MNARKPAAEPRRRISASVQLTLVGTVAAAITAGACSDNDPPETRTAAAVGQQVQGYCPPGRTAPRDTAASDDWEYDSAAPLDPSCTTQPRAGYMPVFLPFFFGGYFYDRGGRAWDQNSTRFRQAEASHMRRTGRPLPSSAYASGGRTQRSGVSRGGFGSTGSSRGGSYS